MFSSYRLAVCLWPLGSVINALDLVSITTNIRLLFLLISCTCLGIYAGPRYASRIVETNSGQIRGILQELNDRLDPVEIFKGIPYAAPPIGNLRLKDPEPPIPWPGVKLADTFGFVCPQKLPDISNHTTAIDMMPMSRYLTLQKMLPHLKNYSEDCLTLNLYIPGSGSRGLEAPYAVIVYIHGESFEWGSGIIYDGSVLASAGHVIVVTLNYRLGILGFLRTRTKPDANGDIGGNMALKDITMCLRWIKKNIAAFGGDPMRVTLMGHDTGAALANLLLLASYSKGLLHRVILLSGSALSPWSSVHDQHKLRDEVSKQVGCSTTDENSDIAECLQNISLEQLLSLELPEIKFIPRIGPILPIDKDNPDLALDMERMSKTFINVPLILGVTTAESYLDFNDNDIQFGIEENRRNRILRTFIRNSYYYHLNEILSAVKNEYTDWDKPILHPVNIMESTIEALSDGHTVAPLLQVAFYHARRGAQTYFFHFNYQSKDSKYPQRLGTVRGEDIPYIFGLPLILGGPFFSHNYSRQDQGVAEAVLTFFTNFAKTANPNLPHHIESVDYGTEKEKARFRGLYWEQYETGSQLYLTIALKPKMKSHYRGHKMAMWLNLIPQLHQPGDNDVSMRHHHFRDNEDHFYAGPVRDEWYSPVPFFDTTKSTIISTVCSSPELNDQVTPNVVTMLTTKDNDQEFERKAARHYYSTTAALAITVGVGCILLILNILIFAGIYYQRDRDKKRALNYITNGSEVLQMNVRLPVNPVSNFTNEEEPPPSYATLPETTYKDSKQDKSKVSNRPLTENTKISDTIKNNEAPKNISSECTRTGAKPPKPPIRNTSSLSSTTGVVKKRVQIQEVVQ